MSDIGKNITRIRTNLQMTQTELAGSMEVSKQCISSWENGRTIPSITSLERLSWVLGCEVSDLTGAVKEAPKPEPAPTSFGSEALMVALAYQQADPKTQEIIRKILEV